MKKLVNVVEVENCGLTALLGESVLFFCMNYFYWGKLVGVNDTQVEVSNPHIVYETGKWDAKTFADAQKLPTDSLLIRLASIEAYFARP